ncbi:response regulator [Paraburkholderia phymatum]|uniref:Response regulator receiver protein n=1 Tax=Paraburkholderia phymatum (strain DSM 17167 / CIP 108236 / LMG 21445 / STM815) TaxID=391038 RepID=B2JMC1_PARP8|nr:response regulator [Paraburkholderia phymatum]ACC74256.1 response regulator receiver protein [Paraburkholderia phymatum STM815]
MSRVLLADDDANVRDALRTVLEGAGYDVTIAQDGLDGLRLAPESCPQVIVTDVMMPLMSGPEMVRRIRAMPGFQQIPVIVMSALATDPEVAVAAMLRKPFAPETLLALLDNLDDAGVATGKRARDAPHAPTAETDSVLDFGVLQFTSEGEKMGTASPTEARIRRGIELVHAQQERLQRLRSLGVDTTVAEELHDSLKHSVSALVLLKCVKCTASSGKWPRGRMFM